jgi:hypothetical protein
MNFHPGVKVKLSLYFKRYCCQRFNNKNESPYAKEWLESQMHHKDQIGEVSVVEARTLLRGYSGYCYNTIITVNWPNNAIFRYAPRDLTVIEPHQTGNQ